MSENNATPSSDGHEIPPVVMDLSEAPEPTTGPGPEAVPVQEEAPVTQTDVAQEEKPAPVHIPAQMVRLDMPVYIAVKPGEFDPSKSTLVLPPGDSDYVSEQVRTAPNIKLDDTPDSAKWASVLEEGYEIIARGDRFKSTLLAADSLWRQKISTPNGDIWSRTPNFSPVENQDLKGEQGVLQFLQYMQMGSQFKVFLAHSGFWLTLKAPTEDQLLALNTEMANDKTQAGRESYGLTFSAMTSYTVDRMCNLALSCVITNSIAEKVNYKDLLLSHDMPTLAWAMANTIWINGHQYSRACANIAEACTAVLEEKLDIAKLMWINTNAFTDWQLRHMTQHAANKMAVADVKRYQAESLQMQNSAVTLLRGEPNEVTFVFSIPTLADFITKSHAWISEMVLEINRAVGVEAEERNLLIQERCRAAWMRQYQAWVKEIKIGSNTISDPSTVAEALSRLSAQDEVRERFMEEVDKYIDRSCISVIGIPAYTCPKCGKDHGPTEHKEGFTNIIPIDMVKTFFILNVQKVLSIRSRSARG